MTVSGLQRGSLHIIMQRPRQTKMVTSRVSLYPSPQGAGRNSMSTHVSDRCVPCWNYIVLALELELIHKGGVLRTHPSKPKKKRR